MSLIELAERVERASGPDARLGAEIEIAVRGFPQRAYAQKNAMRPRGAPEPNRLEWATSFFGSGPTGSLDAAMALVPKGWRTVEFTETEIEGHPPMIWRLGERNAGFGRAKVVEAAAATPALALCAAALRARAQQEQTI